VRIGSGEHFTATGPFLRYCLMAQPHYFTSAGALVTGIISLASLKQVWLA